MLSAYVEVLLCVIELLAFMAFKNTTESFIFMENNKNRKFTIFNVHGNLKAGMLLFYCNCGLD